MGKTELEKCLAGEYFNGSDNVLSGNDSFCQANP